MKIFLEGADDNCRENENMEFESLGGWAVTKKTTKKVFKYNF